MSACPLWFYGQRAPQRVQVPRVILVLVRRVQFFHADPLELCAEHHVYYSILWIERHRRVLSSTLISSKIAIVTPPKGSLMKAFQSRKPFQGAQRFLRL